MDRDGAADAPAVIDLGAGPAAHIYTYCEIDALANATARGLLARKACTEASVSASCRQTAASSSAPFSASCAPAWSQCR